MVGLAPRALRNCAPSAPWGAPARPLNFTVRAHDMKPSQFNEGMTRLLNSLCDHHAWGPLRTILPHYPMPNGFSDELTGLTTALKTVRMQRHNELTADELKQLIELQHVAEARLHRKD